MAWNFRRRKKIAPGVYINMSKKGISTTFGPKGASMTFGPNGTYMNTSIPGTGMYNRRRIGGNKMKINETTSIPYLQRKSSNNEGCLLGLRIVLYMYIGGLIFAGILIEDAFWFLDMPWYINLLVLSPIAIFLIILLALKSKRNRVSKRIVKGLLDSRNIDVKPKQEPTKKSEDIVLPNPEKYDPLLLDILKYVVSKQEGSIAAIQRQFELGFIRAGKIAEQLQQLGVFGSLREAEGYEVLVKDINQLQDVLLGRNISNLKPTPRTKTKSHTSELDALVGLASVKEEIKTLSNFIKIQQKRKEQGLKSSSVSYHCVFTGNPGTGKTTVARIVAQIYKDLGILSKGHLVETDRAGLVAEYVGQTAVKTNKIIDSALDGVLFIDEAYSLIGTGQDYGKEAIATLLKRMEDNRDRLVVILAGYSKEMQDFINTNPGLQSRFNRYIDFPDYSAAELLQIFQKNVEKFDYKLDKEALVSMSEYFRHAVENKDANFGNARFVRNIFEKTLEKQANRLSTDPELDTNELTLITLADLPIE